MFKIMLIGGFQRISLIDYPGKISCIIFIQGCNFRCPFCHNASLVDPTQFQSVIQEEEIFSFLNSRSHLIDGVVISGGEPTLHKDLKEFIEKIKNLHLNVKLDTNGTNPEVVINLLKENLLDFIAMDVKHDWEKYQEASGTYFNISKIKESVDVIMRSNVDYEFRTTIVPGIHKDTDIINISKNLQGAKKFVIQQFVPDHALDFNLRRQKLSSIFDKGNTEQLNFIKSECLKYVQIFETRSAN